MPFKLDGKLLNLAKVFSLVDEDCLFLKEGVELLNSSYWHFSRLYKKYKTQGFHNLLKRERKGRLKDLLRR